MIQNLFSRIFYAWGTLVQTSTPITICNIIVTCHPHPMSKIIIVICLLLHTFIIIITFINIFEICGVCFNINFVKCEQQINLFITIKIIAQVLKVPSIKCRNQENVNIIKGKENDPEFVLVQTSTPITMDHLKIYF
jgi:hypothetical protein